jgi:hypothetical protein
MEENGTTDALAQAREQIRHTIASTRSGPIWKPRLRGSR